MGGRYKVGRMSRQHADIPISYVGTIVMAKAK